MTAPASRGMELARRNRCVHQTVYEVLLALTRRPQGKTRLCLLANMPLDRCSDLLLELESYGLVYRARDGHRDVYRISEAGYIYVGLYEELLKLAPVFERRTK